MIQRFDDRNFNVVEVAIVVDQFGLFDLYETCLVSRAFYSFQMDGQNNFVLILFSRSDQLNSLVERKDVSFLSDVVNITNTEVNLVGDGEVLVSQEHFAGELDFEGY